MQKVVNQHVLEQRISKDREVVLKQVTLHAIFKAKRLNLRRRGLIHLSLYSIAWGKFPEENR